MKKLLLSLLFTAITQLAMAANANVIVLDDSTYIVSSLTDATISYQRTLLITNSKGKDAAFWSCTLDKNMKLKNFSITYQQGDGKIVKKFKKNDLQVTELSAGLGDDNQTYYLDDSPSAYPVTIKQEWTVENHGGVLSYPMFCPMDNYNQAVNHASYTIKCTDNHHCQYKVLNGEHPLITSLNDGSIKAVFDNLPPLEKEDYSPSLFNRLPIVLFTPKHFSYFGTEGDLDTWQNFGRWQYGLLKGRDILPANIKTKVHELTDGLTSQREKVARLYQYLYDNSRYVSIQLGIGGYQPTTAQEVATNGFGDCKGLSNYMIALLKEAGVPAFYAAISTEHTNLVKDFPNLNQLNHVIAGVPLPKESSAKGNNTKNYLSQNDTLWLECTNARYPLGYVHSDIAGHEALIITPDGGKIVRLPKNADTDNLQQSKVDILLNENGEADINIMMEKRNQQYENFLPLLSMNSSEQKKVILSHLHLPSAQVKAMKIEEEKGKPIARTTISATSKYANVTGKRLFIKMNPMKGNFSNKTIQASRQSPLELSTGYHDIEDITLTIPQGFKVESMPSNKEISSKFGTIKVNISPKGNKPEQENKLNVRYDFTMHSGTYPAQEYTDFVKFYNQVAQIYRQQLVIVKP